MEQSHNQFDEKIPPSASSMSFSQHQNHPGIQTQPGFDNSGFQPDFNQTPGFVQQPNTTHVFVLPQQNTNNSFNRNYKRNASIAGGK